MEVTEVCEEWPESSRRQRRWTSPARTLQHIGEPSLRLLLRKVLTISSLEIAPPIT
jgi:hypothetical protein